MIGSAGKLSPFFVRPELKILILTYQGRPLSLTPTISSLERRIEGSQQRSLHLWALFLHTFMYLSPVAFLAGTPPRDESVS